MRAVFYKRLAAVYSGAKVRTAGAELADVLGRARYHFYEAAATHEWKHAGGTKRLYAALENLLTEMPAASLNVTDTVLELGTASTTMHARRPWQRRLRALLKMLIPWRKGPYCIWGTFIVSEWQSHLKWTRMAPTLLAAVAGKRVIDIGANNGYFMLRLLPAQPAWVLGLEPTLHYAAQYDLLRVCLARGAQAAALLRQELVTAGYAALAYLQQTADVILLLGILYHHRDPLGILRLVHGALRTGGRVLIDCQGITENAGTQSQQPLILVPEQRYGGKRGFWFLPTPAALYAWLRRTGFTRMETIYTGKLEVTEQRQTPWAPGPSFPEGLRAGQQQTVEGYSSPLRTYVWAYK